MALSSLSVVQMFSMRVCCGNVHHASLKYPSHLFRERLSRERLIGERLGREILSRQRFKDLKSAMIATGHTGAVGTMQQGVNLRHGKSSWQG
jgi:hypothetical protein